MGSLLTPFLREKAQENHLRVTDMILYSFYDLKDISKIKHNAIRNTHKIEFAGWSKERSHSKTTDYIDATEMSSYKLDRLIHQYSNRLQTLIDNMFCVIAYHSKIEFDEHHLNKGVILNTIKDKELSRYLKRLQYTTHEGVSVNKLRNTSCHTKSIYWVSPDIEENHIISDFRIQILKDNKEVLETEVFEFCLGLYENVLNRTFDVLHKLLSPFNHNKIYSHPIE